MAASLCTVPSLKTAAHLLGLSCRVGGVALHCGFVIFVISLSGHSCRGVVVVLHCQRAQCHCVLLPLRMYLHCRPAQGARLPCTGAFRAGAARRAGSGGVVRWANSGATRDRVGSGGTRGARAATICHVTRDQGLYHMPG